MKETSSYDYFSRFLGEKFNDIKAYLRKKFGPYYCETNKTLLKFKGGEKSQDAIDVFSALIIDAKKEIQNKNGSKPAFDYIFYRCGNAIEQQYKYYLRKKEKYGVTSDFTDTDGYDNYIRTIYDYMLRDHNGIVSLDLLSMKDGNYIWKIQTNLFNRLNRVNDKLMSVELSASEERNNTESIDSLSADDSYYVNEFFDLYGDDQELINNWKRCCKDVCWTDLPRKKAEAKYGDELKSLLDYMLVKPNGTMVDFADYIGMPSPTIISHFGKGRDILSIPKILKHYNVDMHKLYDYMLRHPEEKTELLSWLPGRNLSKEQPDLVEEFAKERNL